MRHVTWHNKAPHLASNYFELGATSVFELGVISISSLIFNRRFQDHLPADPLTENSLRQVQAACFSYVDPKRVSAPQLVAYSHELATELGLSQDYCTSAEFLDALSGNAKVGGMAPYAMCYGGHQFGNWAGQLGDGRAINLGEVSDRQGRTQTIQLKGAGPTPYSRSADGLAVLRSSIREFLCSEAMHHLGVPTTRALSLALSGEGVERDMMYSGDPQIEPGAIVARVAPSFIRFGNFEIFASRGDVATLEKLVAYTIEFDFPELHEEYLRDRKSAVLNLLRKVSQRTCDMIVAWMRVGFVHGVMNTDNMSILGLTIDYGPYGWLDNFDPTWTPNTTDVQHRRYRFENQPAIAQWNLLQLANALYPLVESAEELEVIVHDFKSQYEASWQTMMGQKLGLHAQPNNAASLAPLYLQLEKLLAESELDMTLFYRSLSTSSCETLELAQPCENYLQELSYKKSLTRDEVTAWCEWFRDYNHQVKNHQVKNNQVANSQCSSEERVNMMEQNNPVFILRNFIAQEAIEKAYEADYSLIEQLLTAIAHPYENHASHKVFSKKRPEWALNKAGCSMLSCSS